MHPELLSHSGAGGALRDLYVIGFLNFYCTYSGDLVVHFPIIVFYGVGKTTSIEVDAVLTDIVAD